MPESAYIGLPVFIPGFLMYYATRFFQDGTIKRLSYSFIPHILFFIYFYISAIYLNTDDYHALEKYALFGSLASLLVATIFYIEKKYKVAQQQLAQVYRSVNCSYMFLLDIPHIILDRWIIDLTCNYFLSVRQSCSRNTMV